MQADMTVTSQGCHVSQRSSPHRELRDGGRGARVAGLCPCAQLRRCRPLPSGWPGGASLEGMY